MKRTIGAIMPLALATTALAPSTAFARDRRYDDHSSYSHSYNRHRGDNAVAAGVVGLALGAVLGAAISNSHRRNRCDERCQYDRRYNDGYYNDGYRNDGYNDGYYNNGYGDGYGSSVCVVRERRWDPYAGREVVIEEQRPC